MQNPLTKCQTSTCYRCPSKGLGICQFRHPYERKHGSNFDIPWKFKIAPENGWLEDKFPFGKAYVQGLC